MTFTSVSPIEFALSLERPPVRRKEQVLLGLGAGCDGGSPDDQEFVFFAVGFELHPIFVEGEVDRSVRLEDIHLGGFNLPDLKFSRGRVNGVLVAEDNRGLLLALIFGAALDGCVRNDCRLPFVLRSQV
jgi:hypothetical protein